MYRGRVWDKSVCIYIYSLFSRKRSRIHPQLLLTTTKGSGEVSDFWGKGFIVDVRRRNYVKGKRERDIFMKYICTILI